MCVFAVVAPEELGQDLKTGSGMSLTMLSEEHSLVSAVFARYSRRAASVH
jgi:hypothetical protein